MALPISREVALGGTSSTHATIKAEKSDIQDGALIVPAIVPFDSTFPA